MNSTITTSIRWKIEEIQDVKRAAEHVGLPVALFVKSIALSKIRNNTDDEITASFDVSTPEGKRTALASFEAIGK